MADPQAVDKHFHLRRYQPPSLSLPVTRRSENATSHAVSLFPPDLASFLLREKQPAPAFKSTLEYLLTMLFASPDDALFASASAQKVHRWFFSWVAPAPHVDQSAVICSSCYPSVHAQAEMQPAPTVQVLHLGRSAGNELPLARGGGETNHHMY